MHDDRLRTDEFCDYDQITRLFLIVGEFQLDER